MSFYDRLAERARPVAMSPQVTSYFSAPEDTLDPRLFNGDAIKGSVRNGILGILHGFWRGRYAGVESWSRVWLAGSGVSFQWSAARQPGDLDVLVGVDFVAFRRANPELAGLSDGELAAHLNQELHDVLWPQTSNWHGYEVTFYVNPDSYDITRIHPYAAYSLTDNKWTVRPEQAGPAGEPGWDVVVSNDTSKAAQILARYNKAYDEVSSSTGGHRLNASITLRTAAMEGAALFDEIHEGRKKAFSPTGGGYHDVNEYRYKAAKGSGALTALRELKEELRDAGLLDEEETYGSRLPSAREVLVQAAISRRYKP